MSDFVKGFLAAMAACAVGFVIGIIGTYDVQAQAQDWYTIDHSEAAAQRCADEGGASAQLVGIWDATTRLGVEYRCYPNGID